MKSLFAQELWFSLGVGFIQGNGLQNKEQRLFFGRDQGEGYVQELIYAF
jgi:hypothetical protein